LSAIEKQVLPPILQFALRALAWIIALAWLWKAITAALGLRRVPDLTRPEYNLAPPNDPSITVIVPARNESADIAATLQSLLAQDYPSLHIIAIDDRSTDTTGAIMDAQALHQPARLTILHVNELPGGWLGKTHAMALAARHALSLHHPDYLLFTDADILFRSDALRLALAHIASLHADHLVVLPTTIIKSPGEGMLLSYLQVMGLWAVRPWRIDDPKSLRDAVGVGAFNLVRTQAYQKIGGYDSLRMEIVEDLAFGRRIKRAGLRQRIATAPGLIRVHWATGVSGILNGMIKNLFAIFGYRIPLVLLSCVGTTILCIAPALFLIFAQTRTPAILTIAAIVFLYALSSRQSKVSPWYAPLFPVSAALIVVSILRSMFTTLRQGGVIWRGTFYPLAELRKNATPFT
jgi:glycosyltransferase involved in cell wall biosynthesis